MKRTDLDRAFPETPQAFSERMTSRSGGKTREKSPSRLSVAALITLLAAGAACACQLGQEWYFNTRFTAIRT